MGLGAFVTGFTSASIEAAARARPEHFRVVSSSGLAAAEEAVAGVLALAGGSTPS